MYIGRGRMKTLFQHNKKNALFSINQMNRTKIFISIVRLKFKQILMKKKSKFKKLNLLDRILLRLKKDKSTKISLGVLGYAGSGKTEFLYQLSGKTRTDHRGTIVEEFKSINLKNSKKIFSFEKPKDYGAKPILVRQYLKEIIKDKTNLIVIFNLNNILNKDMNELGYLQNIHLHIEENQKIIYVGSFLDQVKKEIKEDEIRSFLEKEISGFSFKSEMILANLKSRESINEIISKITEI